MRKVLVFQHVAWEILGTLDPLLRKGGFRSRYVNFDRDPDSNPTLEKYNGLFILGGPMGVYEKEKYSHLKTEIRLLEQGLKSGIPILGICLGAQLLAHVLGSPVRKHTEREMGWCPVHLTDAGKADPVLGHFKPTEHFYQSHGDTFDIPKTAAHLAASDTCASQAFRYGENVYGFQFHLEADQAYVDRWLSIPFNENFMENSRGACTPEKIKDETAKYLPRSMDLSQTAFSNFLKLFGDFERTIVFGSGHGKPPRD